jgi:hypothetical protein
VQFRLLYTGLLPSDSSADAQTKHRIRKYFHPQLRRLWSNHPNLIQYAEMQGSFATVPPDGEDRPDLTNAEMALKGYEALARNWNEYGFNFLPLVQKDYCLACSLDILFLRKGGPGRLVTNGDLDGRIKTLFDALQKPQQSSECGGAAPDEDEHPFFVLFQNDKLISEIKVTTDELLDYTGPGLQNQAVHLVINVRLTPTRHGAQNWIFQ